MSNNSNILNSNTSSNNSNNTISNSNGLNNFNSNIIIETFCVLDSNYNVVNTIIADSNFTLPGYTLIINSNVQIGDKFTYSNGQYIPPSNVPVIIPPTPSNTQNIIGLLLGTIFLSNSSGTYIPSSNTSTIQVQLLGAGGGGGGGGGSTSNAGAGGGAGGYGVALLSNIASSNTYTYSNGLGGTGNTLSGSAGTSTCFVYNGSNYIVTGGLGGVVGINSTTTSALGGNGGSASNPSMFSYTIPAQSGGIGLHYTYTTGKGADSSYGTGGISVFNGGNGAGSNGIGYGSGGAGGSGNAKGGNGAPGLIVISEYI